MLPKRDHLTPNEVKTLLTTIKSSRNPVRDYAARTYDVSPWLTP